MNSDLQAQWNKTKKSLDQLRADLTAQRGARDQLLKVQKKEEDILIELKETQRLSHLAQLFLLSEVADRRQTAIDTIEKMGTFALRLVYGEGYKLKFISYEEKRKEGVGNFKMEINVSSPFNGAELSTGLMGERGGGVIEIVSFALRIAALNWAHYEGPLILDEAYKSMSNDDKLEKVAQFLAEVSKQTNRQIIFATHRGEVFGKVAQNIVRVKKNDGVAECIYIDDLADLHDNYSEEVEEEWK